MARISDNYNLYVKNPGLIKEWHPTKNGDLRPMDVTPGSGKKAWWLCPQGHEWQAVIYNRNRGSGCPLCRQRQSAHSDSLMTLSDSGLLKEWHPSKNNGLNPRNLTAAHDKKVWWLCQEGHEWHATIKSRMKGNGCRLCKKGQVQPRTQRHRGASWQKKAAGHKNPSFIFELESAMANFDRDFRKSRRFNVRATAILVIPSTRHWVYAQIRNFSHSGMCIETEASFRKGTNVIVKLDRPLLSSGQKSYNSVIRWCKRSDDDDSQSFSSYGIGIQFI